MKKDLIIRAPFCVRSGYKTLIDTACIELNKNGYNVFPVSTDGKISNPLVRNLIKPLTKELLSKTELCILPVQIDILDFNTFYRIPKVGKRVFLTMWESTQLSMNVIDILNTGVGVIVPNEWNKENFTNDGISKPIFKCPLFVDTSIYKYKPPAKKDVFTFGTGNSDKRKRINDVIRCFSKSFHPKIKDVRFKIKTDNQDIRRVNRFSDDRLEINTFDLTQRELADWYHSLDVFVSGTTSEGWGFMQHESMACGRPLIACEYSGLREFFNPSVGITVKYKEVLSEWSWGYSNGFWSKFDEDDMIDKMKWCYKNQDEILNMGKKSSKIASEYDIKNFVNKLSAILKNFSI